MKKLITLLTLAGLLAPMTALAEEAVPTLYIESVPVYTTATEDTSYATDSFSLVIKAGSVYEDIYHEGDSIFVTVPENEAFEFRSLGPNPRRLENNASLQVCNVTPSRENQLIITGPKTVNIVVSSLFCETDEAEPEDTSQIVISSPSADTELSMGDTHQILWSTIGRAPSYLQLRLSVDGGTTFAEPFAGELFNTGFYNWAVPEVITTDVVRLKIEGINAGRIVAMAVTGDFTIRGLEPPPEPKPVDIYEPAEIIAAAETIGVDKGLLAAELPVGTTTCHPNSRIKTPNSSTLYYCGTDGKRYVFPNRKTHDTWYDSFAGVIEISKELMAQIPIGGNVTYRPGVRMVKIESSPEVFAVDADGVLRWVPDEDTAERLYGENWNQMIDDIPDPFFVNYTVGKPVG